MKRNFRRIMIIGETANSVHGSELREYIQRIANNMSINGQIRNIKGDSKVEIICEGEKEKLDNFFKKIKKLEKCKDKLFNIKEVNNEEELFEFKEFKLVREDELSEMVWALQGAGKVFYATEKTRIESLYDGLKTGITYISIHTGNIRSGEKYSKIPLFIIEHFLQQPPRNTNETVMSNLWELYENCQNINNFIVENKDIKKKEFDESLERVSDIIPTIIETINKNG